MLLLVPAAIAHALIPPWIALAVAGTVLLVGIACDTGIVRWRLPQNARQVPSSILMRTDGSGAFQFGFEMGTGLRTFVPTHLPHVLVAVILFVAPWWLAPVLGASFGLGRTVMVLSSVRSGDATAWDQDFARRRPVILAICWAAALAATALLLVDGPVR